MSQLPPLLIGERVPLAEQPSNGDAARVRDPRHRFKLRMRPVENAAQRLGRDPRSVRYRTVLLAGLLDGDPQPIPQGRTAQRRRGSEA